MQRGFQLFQHLSSHDLWKYNLVQQWRLTLDRNICMYASRRYKKRITTIQPTAIRTDSLFNPCACCGFVRFGFRGACSAFLFDAIALLRREAPVPFVLPPSRLRSAFSSLAFRRADCKLPRHRHGLGSSLKRSWRVNMTSSNCPAFNWACPFSSNSLYSCLLLLLLLVLPFRSF